MDDFSDSVMIALLPITSDWCHIDLPHLTLVYVGATKELKPTVFNELAKDAASIAMLSNTIMLKVLKTEIFGDEDKVDALRLQPSPELLAMRRTVERWNGSEHPFNPHVTIGPTGSFISPAPSYLAFNRIMVGWGKESLTFWLKSN
jgi:2'-5' RNA ligase